MAGPSDTHSTACLSVGFLITSLLDKSHLHAYGSDAWGNEGSIAWRARAVLFVGVALMAGGLAGSLVCSQGQHYCNSNANRTTLGSNKRRY